MDGRSFFRWCTDPDRLSVHLAFDVKDRFAGHTAPNGVVDLFFAKRFPQSVDEIGYIGHFFSQIPFFPVFFAFFHDVDSYVDSLLTVMWIVYVL